MSYVLTLVITAVNLVSPEAPPALTTIVHQYGGKEACERHLSKLENKYTRTKGNIKYEAEGDCFNDWTSSYGMLEIQTDKKSK
ncbi:hypothetical protein RYA05_04505 [Pseudomonas syringae pv. actinidiae]|nr:hypothetical protein [Pseudomonas syringae pv. actinidiae]